MTSQIAPFGLRMPDRLKEQVQQLARAEDRSMNSFIVRTLKTVVEEKTASEPTV